MIFSFPSEGLERSMAGGGLLKNTDSYVDLSEAGGGGNRKGENSGKPINEIIWKEFLA